MADASAPPRRPGPEALATAIAALYEAALDAVDPGSAQPHAPSAARAAAPHGAGLQPALSAVAAAFGATAVTLWRYDHALQGLTEAWWHGHDPATLAQYAAHHVHQDPATPLVLAAGPGRWLADEVLLDPDRREHRAYWHEFARPHGIGRVGGGIVAGDAQTLLYMGVQRPVGAPRWGEDGASCFAQLAPHVDRANRLRQKVIRHTGQQGLAQAVLDRLAWALCVVDAGGQIRQLNAAFARHLQPSGPLRVAHSRLVGGRGVPAGWLPAAIRAACHSPAQPSALRVRGDGARTCDQVLTVLPLAAHHALAAGLPQPMALIGLDRPEAGVASPALLQLAFALTPAEAALLAALAEGRTVQAHALARGVSVSTARTHARALHDKLGARSQLELVALARAVLPQAPS